MAWLGDPNWSCTRTSELGPRPQESLGPSTPVLFSTILAMSPSIGADYCWGNQWEYFNPFTQGRRAPFAMGLSGYGWGPQNPHQAPAPLEQKFWAAATKLQGGSSPAGGASQGMWIRTILADIARQSSFGSRLQFFTRSGPASSVTQK